MSVGLSVGLSVGRCQRVSRSIKCLKDASNHNVTVFYVLSNIFSAYFTLCIVGTIMFMHYEYDAQNISNRNTEMK